jgi:glycerate 2-kinase
MSELKQLARRIFHETLAAIDIPAVFRRKLDRAGSTICCGDRRVDLAPFSALRVIAIGKASLAMVRGLADVLAPDFNLEGIFVGPEIASLPAAPGIRAIAAGHPVPTEASFEAAGAILDLLARCDEKTIVFFLLSGGGSALVELPLDPKVTLADVQELHRVLVMCGGSIEEINAVRKHLSAVKGGRLAAAATHALKLTYGVSDVPAGRESALASGPTLPDPTTIADARDVVARYSLLGKLPARIRAKFAAGGALDETPKAGDGVFRRSRFALLLGMDDLFHPAHRNSEAAGCVTVCDNSTDDWPVARAAEYLLAQLEQQRRANPGRRVAVIADGELSSPVTGDGTGGRNSAFVLECVQRIAGKQIAVLSAGTDGVDGSSPAAGAVADGETFACALAAGLDPAEFARRSDSYSFFNALGDAIVTGPTGNNLRDLRILIAK